MALSREAKLVTGISLLAFPTIQFGGFALFGALAQETAGWSPGDLALNEFQWSLWWRGYAHAGVWLVLSILIQILLDSTRLTSSWKWLARIAAPLAAVAVSAGFLGLAFLPGFQWLLYFGAACLFFATVLSGIGLLRNLSPETSAAGSS